MTFWAYMLRCSDNSYYVGHTDDLDVRIAQHQSGALPGYTQKRRPVDLVWSEAFPERDQAFAAERQIKGWSRLKKQALIDGNWAAVSRLGKRVTVLRDEASPSSASPQDERNTFPPGIAPPPVIVLVRPQLGENIGKAARAMLNFGLTELRLVTPRDGWPNPQAGPAASGADIVLEGARVFDSVAEATADCAHVYATTVRKRGVTKPVVTPEEAARGIHGEPGRSAILFGPERSGLETDDVAVARTIVTVPINPEFGSLNLAQAVILVAYEWSKGMALASPPAVDLDPPAPQVELEGLIGHLDRLLDESGYYFPPDRVPATRRTLRGLLTKPAWNAQEVRTLRGVLSALERPRNR
ncbi:rRNA methyltransferase [Sphingomonas histidinilytica]|uniref:tRNA/rRNA methyltransferase n=1 Tax=Rhizorhabdus histidinilytica TaxID=439228 RepID=A0A1T5BRZ5_9SPHN|nr:TrmH family RNA methyltransferase [Rhizorhabdus histidinilytica]MBO9377480.1 rRNA methyltransferase [Rhizorhabdus histidinilytica]QEH77515.1 rRNA methyltransferase [Sphingomonas sp. C8-2]SKB49899.1 tRNA/rRNA methyltransferase [Rhizorhabdus histidinilytica]